MTDKSKIKPVKFLLSLRSYLNIVYLISCIFCFSTNSNAQHNIIGVPVVGAVTPSSATILFLADTSSIRYFILLKNESSNSKFFPIDVENGVGKIRLENLSSNTMYHYTIQTQTNQDDFRDAYSGSFKTYPAKNDTTIPFSFVFGSCTEQHYDDSIFLEMKTHQPNLFLHLGDWLYTHNFKEEKFYYTQSLEHQKELYQKRYEMPFLKSLLQTTPIDFVFDDEDGVFDDFSKTSYTKLKLNGNTTTIQEISYPDSLRLMAINGLHTFFPSYHEIIQQAYHSFVCGNAEFFFLDTRSTRSPNTSSFVSKGDYYTYRVPQHHAILDTAQLNWLLRGLQQSSAHWKFIVSGVTFNKSYKKILDLMLLKRVQHRKLYDNMTGAYIAAALSSMWFAFPETQAQVLNFCHDNKIKNVIVLSGDAHTAAIDDGTNAGFPEVMAGGLAQKNSKLVSIIQNKLQLNLWNKGGQGIGNANYKDAFGKVEVNGNVSVKLSCIDKYGNTICQYEVKDGFIPEKYVAKKNRVISLGDKIRAAKQALKIKQKL